MKIQSTVLFSPECIYMLQRCHAICVPVSELQHKPITWMQQFSSYDNAAASTLNGSYCALKNQAASSLVYDPIRRRFFFFFGLFYKRAPRGWRKAAHKVKVQLLHLRNATPSKAFLQHFNSFVISACQTWLEQRIITARMQAARVKSISFDAARGLFYRFFFLLSLQRRRRRHFGLTSRCGCHGNRAIWQTWWQRSGKQRSVTKITLHRAAAL